MMELSDDDPIIEGFLRITRRFGVLILAIAVGSTVLGAALGAFLKREYKSTVVVAAAILDPDGPIVDFHTIDVQLETHLEQLVVAGQLSDDTKLDAYAVRDQPPSSRKLPMIALLATSAESVSVRRALDRAQAHLRSLEAPVYAAERRRLEQALESLNQQVERLMAGPVTPKTQEALQRAIYDRAEARRRLSPIRTYPSQALATVPVEQVSRDVRITTFSLLGLAGGISLGYLVAFFFLALETLRRVERGRPG